MNDSLYIAATGMQAQQLNLDTIANNLANVSTSGFKKGRVNFQEMMHADGAEPAAGANPMGLGIGVANFAKDFSAGALTRTGAAMDVAVNGAGFLEVTLADGSRGYTRGGTLQLTKDNYLAAPNGLVLRPGIHVPANAGAILIGADGKVSVQGPGNAAPTEIGQLELANFANPSALAALSGGVYTPTEGSGEALTGRPGTQGLGAIAQGTLENSNVTLVDEMVTLMIAQRAYEMSSKVMQAADELMSLTNNLRR